MAGAPEGLGGLDELRVEERKITDYLLSPTHPDGKPKARFFVSHGFTPQRWEELAEALREHARAYPVSGSRTLPHGVNYVVEGPLACPDGRRPRVTAVWHVPAGATFARLATSYPAKDKQ